MPRGWLERGHRREGREEMQKALLAAETNAECCCVSAALQESVELSALWHRRPSQESFSPERFEEAQAEWAALQAWFERLLPPAAQVLAAWHTVHNGSHRRHVGAESRRCPGHGGGVDVGVQLTGRACLLLPLRERLPEEARHKSSTLPSTGQRLRAPSLSFGSLLLHTSPCCP